jgi:RimJ/RimL family protein N-acetyltransferase
MQNIFYRQLFPADYDEYRRIRLECLKQFPNYFGSIYEEELISESLKLDGAIKFSDSNNFALGAFSDEKKIIAVCGLVTDLRSKTKHRGEVVQMYVDTEFAGRGIGRKLLQLTIDRAFNNKQTEQVTLGVVYTNENAIKLYKQAGFVEYGRLEKFFKMETQYSTQLFMCLTKKNWQKQERYQVRNGFGQSREQSDPWQHKPWKG